MILIGDKMITREKFNIEIKNIVSQLIAIYKPKKIILFGSLANGLMKEGADIDLFIVKDDIPKYGVDRIRQLDKMIHYRLATDFIVYRSDELEKRIKLGDPFIKNILEEGKVLYNAE